MPQDGHVRLKLVVEGKNKDVAFRQAKNTFHESTFKKAT
jgi:hypothetical protein